MNADAKLVERLSAAGYEICAPKHGRLIAINGAKIVGDWNIAVYKRGQDHYEMLFNSLDQVRTWIDNGFKDEFLPKIPLEDGTFGWQKNYYD